MSSIVTNLIYIGNYADVDTDETNFTTEAPGNFYRTFSNADIQVTRVWQNDANSDGFVQSDDNGQVADTFTFDVGAGSVTSALDSEARYLVDYVDGRGDVQSTTISIYQTQSGDTFARFPDGVQIQSFTVKSIQADGYSSINHGATSTAQVVCFAAGTMIETDNGLRPVEEISVGDQVITLDHGLQTVRWIQDQRMTVDQRSMQKPILITEGALGRDCPERDLVVSPQHRILVGGHGQLTRWFKEEVFVSAKALTKLPGVRVMKGKKEITWVHFALDRHEIVSASGCRAESLLLGPMVVAGFSEDHRRELFQIFGASTGSDVALNGPMARRQIKTRIARGILAKPETGLLQKMRETTGHLTREPRHTS